MWRMVPNPFTADSGNPTEMKNYFHVDCFFETLTRCRATTKVIDSSDDIEGSSKLTSASCTKEPFLFLFFARRRFFRLGCCK